MLFDHQYMLMPFDKVAIQFILTINVLSHLLGVIFCVVKHSYSLYVLYIRSKTIKYDCQEDNYSQKA